MKNLIFIFAFIIAIILTDTSLALSVSQNDLYGAWKVSRITRKNKPITKKDPLYLFLGVKMEFYKNNMAKLIAEKGSSMRGRWKYTKGTLIFFGIKQGKGLKVYFPIRSRKILLVSSLKDKVNIYLKKQ